MNKMVINHLEKLFVTSDASTIVSELEVQHPAAKLLVMAAQAQEHEIGDGTNLVRLCGATFPGSGVCLSTNSFSTWKNALPCKSYCRARALCHVFGHILISVVIQFSY